MAISLKAQVKLRTTASQSVQGAPSAVTIPANSLALIALQDYGDDPSTAAAQLKPLSFGGNPWTRHSQRSISSPFSYWAWWSLFTRFELTDVPDWTSGSLSPTAIAAALFVLSGAEMSPFAGATYSDNTTISSTTYSGTFTPTTTGSLMLGQFMFAGVRSTEIGTPTVSTPSTATPANTWRETSGTFAAAGGMFVKSGSNSAGSGINWQFSDVGYTGTDPHTWTAGLIEVKPRVAPYPFAGWGVPLR